MEEARPHLSDKRLTAVDNETTNQPPTKSYPAVQRLRVASKQGAKCALLTMTVLLLCGLVSTTASTHRTASDGTASPQIRVYFSPKGGCTDAVVSQIESSKKTILVQAYLFESDCIAKAIVAAKERGVTITVVLDTFNERDKYSAVDTMNNAGIPTYIDAEHATAHNKIIIIDGQTVITGSFN